MAYRLPLCTEVNYANYGPQCYGNSSQSTILEEESSTSRSLKHSHSVLPTSGLASSSTYHPRRAASVAPDTRVDDAYLFDRVSGASYLSNATLDDCDDTVRRSRGRDAQLLRDATNAISRFDAHASKVISKVVVRNHDTMGEMVRTLDYDTAKKRSRFLKAAARAPPPVQYFPSPHDLPDPRLNVPKRGQAAPEDDESRDVPPRPTVNCSKFYACGGDPANPPLSDLRRRIRRTLNKSRRHSSVN